jgi:uncharacterized paraquat-inducible protein A
MQRSTYRYILALPFVVLSSIATAVFAEYMAAYHGGFRLGSTLLRVGILALGTGGVVLLLGPLWLWPMRRREMWAKRTRHGLPTCHNCGYDLAGLQRMNCPECGSPVSEEHPAVDRDAGHL